jgi:hypothetical protein
MLITSIAFAAYALQSIRPDRDAATGAPFLAMPAEPE